MKPEPAPLPPLPLSPDSAPAESSLSRRDFVVRFALWGGWAALGLSLIQRLQVPAYQAAGQQVLLERPEAYPLGLTELPLYQAWLIRNAEGFYALKAVCTHLGCPPQWQPASGGFACPCHGSRFDLSGKLVRGPALRALERYEISRAGDGRLTLNLARTYRREDGGWNQPKAFVGWKG